MRKIRNQNLSQLLMQLRFAPLRQRQKQLTAAEDLCVMIEAEKDYPFDFVCYRITGHSPKEDVHEIIKGMDLLSDLQIFISKLSSLVADNAADNSGKVYTLEELAEEFNVSTKTINRWRKKGLVARKFVFEDGGKRLGFEQHRVEKFAAENSEFVEKAASFTRFDKNKKNQILSCVRGLAKKETTLRQVILTAAAQLDVSAETVRIAIKNYELEHPGKSLVANVRKMIRPTQAAEVYRLHQQGVGLKELTERFSKCRSTIYRIINQRREKVILARKIEYIDSPDFSEPDAFDKICDDISLSEIEKPKGIDNLLKQFESGGKGVSLTRQQEIELFRKYNFLKFIAACEKEKINLAKVNARLVTRIENCMSLAEAIKNFLTEANMRLVTTIAQKHAASGFNMQDLVGEGHISLMRAVEKFNYTRGFRFATYASWVIAKDFARKIPAEQAKQKKISDTDVETLHKDFKSKFEFKASDSSLTTIEQAGRDINQVLRDNLDQREQFIIINHFGLSGSLVKKEKKTLQQIGQELDLSKERVRQIELTALQKLRQILSIEQFELLTG